MKKYIIPIVIVVTISLFYITGAVQKDLTYSSAKELIKKEQWSEAYFKLDKIQGYKDSDEIMKNVKYHYYLQLGDIAIKNKNFSLALSHYKLAQEANSNDNKIEQKIITAKKLLVVKQEKAQPKYKLTEFQLVMMGDNWKYVLIPSDIKQDELAKIAKDLHNKYPTICFKLFSSQKFLKLMYNYDLTNSYVTGKFNYSDADYEKYNRGLINKMAGVWTYTTSNYESIEL